MTINVKKLNKLIIYCVFILFLGRFFTLDIINQNNMVSEIYTLISQVLTVGILCSYLYLRRFKINSFILGIILIFVYFLFTTFIHDGNIRRVFMQYYPIIGFICFIDLVTKKDLKGFVTAFSHLMYILVLINFIDLLIFRDTSSSYSTTTYFLANKNGLGIVFSIGMAFIKDYIDNYSKKNRIGKIAFIGSYTVIVVLSALKTQSATSIVCITALLGVYYLPKKKSIDAIRNPTIFLIIYFFIWIALVIFRAHELLAGLVIGVLSRDLTLTHRTLVWDEVLSMLSNHFFLGNGFRDSVNLFTVSYHYIGGGGYTTSTFSAHNQVLQNLYEGGIFSIVLILVLYFFATSKKKQSGDSFLPYFGAVILILIVWLTEAPSNNALFVMLGMIYYSARFRSNNKSSNISHQIG